VKRTDERSADRFRLEGGGELNGGDWYPEKNGRGVSMPTITQEFDEFWVSYPRRVGKLAAVKAYQKARIVATAEEILQGVRQYCEHLPSDTQFIAHAATWLNQGRWMDEYAPAPVLKRVHWSDECQQLHGGQCSKQWDHEMRKRESA